MAQTRYKQNIDTWRTVDHIPVVTDHALVTLTPIKPSYGEELWNSAVAGARAALKWSCIIIGGLLFIGLLAHL
jgi:hypothetical protein